MAKLVCQSGPNAGHEYPITKDRTVFGRQKTCDYQIIDKKASREHFAITRYEHQFTVADLGSRNGTLLNDLRINERVLDFDDIIRIGETEYLLVREEGDKSLSDLLSKYRIEKKVGEGGMGVVYRAKQRSMDRSVALKMLIPKFSKHEKFIDNFIREARAAGALNHPNIIQVHDVGSENGLHYFSMEFIDGLTCQKLLEESGPMDAAQVLEIARQTAKALEYAHSQKIIHRDIKPDNIMLSDGNTVKLADLGISKTFEEAERSAVKRIVGTPYYLAPEAARLDRIDHRVDIYSLGATCFHLLTGRPPFKDGSSQDIVNAQINDIPPAIAELKPDTPAPVVELVEKMMAKHPDERFQDAASLITAIESIQQSGAVPNSGSDTIILRRFATGAAQGANEGGAGRSTAAGTRSGSRARKTGSSNTQKILLIVGGVLLLILILIGIIVASVMNTFESAEAMGRLTLLEAKLETITTSEDEQELEALRALRDQVQDIPTEGDSIREHKNDLLSGISLRIATIERSIAKREAEAAAIEQQIHARQKEVQEQLLLLEQQLSRIDTIEGIIDWRRRLSQFEGQDLNDYNSKKLAVLRKSANTAQADIEQDIADEAFDTMLTQLNRLLEARDYEAARSLVEDFKTNHQDNALQVERADTWLKTIATRDNDRKDDLQGRYEILEDNIDGLRKLYNEELTTAERETDIGTTIADRIEELENQVVTVRSDAVDRAKEHIAKWKRDAFLDLYKDRRAKLGESSYGEQLDELKQTVEHLDAFINTVDTGLKPEKRFRGSLKGCPEPNPYLTSASWDGITVQLRSQIGRVTVDWNSISLDQITQIMQLAEIVDPDSHFTDALETQKAIADELGIE